MDSLSACNSIDDSIRFFTGINKELNSLSVARIRRQSFSTRESLSSWHGNSLFCTIQRTPCYEVYSPALKRISDNDLGFVCKSSRKDSSAHSSPEEDDFLKDLDPRAPKADEKIRRGQRSNKVEEVDWRAFRASLVASEQASLLSNSGEPSVIGITKTIKKTWAHPLHVPEAGCVLVATDKLDGQIDFERTVILLLRVGSNSPRDGPFGIILNRPTSQTINDLQPQNKTLSNVFGNCEYFYGGPLESELFLLMQEGGPMRKFGEIIPGISHVGLDGLQHAMRLVEDGILTPNDFRLYLGYAGWGLEQLMNEIESGYWHLAACSTTLLKMTSTDRLWQKILRLMGGRYTELSRKPRKSDI